MKLIACILVIYSCILSYGCEGVITGLNFNPTPPRLLEWSIDTLAYSPYDQTMMSILWAASPTDVYAVGHCSSVKGAMYHYDGKEWKRVRLSVVEGGPVVNNFGIDAIFGLSSNDIYAVGSRSLGYDQPEVGLLIHFNGSSWQMIDIPDGERLYSVWGSTPTDVWVGGFRGRLLHSDGAGWTTYQLPHPGYPQIDISLVMRDITGNATETYFHTYTVRYLQSDLHHFFRYQDGNLSLLDSLTGYHHEVWMSPTGTLYKGDEDGLSFWNDSSWVYLVTGRAIFDITGPDDSNLFCIGQHFEHRVYHYNGQDCFEYENLKVSKATAVYSDIFYISGHVYIVGHTNNEFPERTIILHGQ